MDLFIFENEFGQEKSIKQVFGQVFFGIFVIYGDFNLYLFLSYEFIICLVFFFSFKRFLRDIMLSGLGLVFCDYYYQV